MTRRSERRKKRKKCMGGEIRETGTETGREIGKRKNIRSRSPHQLRPRSSLIPISSATHHSNSGNVFAKEENDHSNSNGYFSVRMIHPSSAIHKAFSSDEEEVHSHSDEEENQHVQQQQPQSPERNSAGMNHDSSAKKPKWFEECKPEQFTEKNKKLTGRRKQFLRVKSNIETLAKKITDDLRKASEELQSYTQKNELDLQYYKAWEAKQGTKQLAEMNKKLADDLRRAEEEVESYNKKFEQKCNQLEALQTQHAAMQQDLECASHSLEYCKARERRFDDLEAQCVTARAETQQFAEKNKKIADDLVKTKEEVEFYKQKFKKKSYALEEMQRSFAALKQDSILAKEDSDSLLVALTEDLRFAAENNNRIYKEKDKLAQDLQYARDSFNQKSAGLEQALKCANEVNNQICKEKDKLAEDLKYTRQQLEYYNQIGHLKSALKGLAEFSGLKQVLHRQGHSDPQSSVEHTMADTEVYRKRRYVLKVYEMDESLNCPICLEAWSEAGEHNMCSLPCGHFFGRSCITNWFKKSAAGSSKCPLCLEVVTVGGIRNHYMPQAFVGNEEI